MASDDLVVNRVHSSTTPTPGRATNRIRDQELVIDEPTHLGGPGERVTPADAFLAGVSACGVLMVEGQARSKNIRVERVEVELEAVRRRTGTQGRPPGGRQERPGAATKSARPAWPPPDEAGFQLPPAASRKA